MIGRATDPRPSTPDGEGAGHRRHVLVTGGAGYLGSVLVRQVLDMGAEVTVVDAFLFGIGSLSALIGHPRLHIVRADIAAADGIPLTTDVDTVVHLASVSNDPSCDLDPTHGILVNYRATLALARRARAVGIARFVFASSCSVYGARGDEAVDERSDPGPVTLYALTKLASEREILELATGSFQPTVLRFATLFGASPRMRFDLAVNLMTKRAFQGEPIVINGAGAQFRPFVHVADAAEAVVGVIGATTDLVGGRLFNVGCDEMNLTISGLAEEVSAVLPGVRIERAEAGDDVRSYRVRFQRIRDALGFVPSRSIADGVREVRNELAAGRYGDPDAEAYYNVRVAARSHRTVRAMPSSAVFAKP